MKDVWPKSSHKYFLFRKSLFDLHTVLAIKRIGIGPVWKPYLKLISAAQGVMEPLEVLFPLILYVFVIDGFEDIMSQLRHPPQLKLDKGMVVCLEIVIKIEQKKNPENKMFSGFVSS